MYVYNVYIMYTAHMIAPALFRFAYFPLIKTDIFQYSYNKIHFELIRCAFMTNA